MRAVVATDPVDARLLGVVAEMGRAAVHEVARRMGMDPREVASRLVALSGQGLPLLVGVECDSNALRAAATALANVAAPATPQGPPSGPYGTPSGPYGVRGTPSGGYQTPPPGQYPGPQQPGPPAGPPSGPHPLPGGPHPVPTGPPSAPVPAHTGPPSNPFPAPNQPGQPGQPSQPTQPPPPPPAVEAPANTWGPPQTASWARGDQPPEDLTLPTIRTDDPDGDATQGTVGTTLRAEGLEGERLAIQLVEVVDPADYLFTAAGYRLQDGERSVVVHTELTNQGATPYQSLPDMYLVLVTPDGETISKAAVSLSSRPPHRIGVPPGETAGGHTVFVLGENTPVNAVRWCPRPDDEARTLTWTLES